MKKNVLYSIIAAIVGLLAGYLIFGDTSDGASAEEHDHGQEMASGQMWTCSMHPQIMQPEPGDCPICAMDLIPAASSDDGLAKDQFKMTENAMALADIQTTVVGSGSVGSNSLKLSGKIAENVDEMATQPAHFNGRIDKLFIKTLGEKVHMGQAIAQIYSPELVAAQQELITAYRLKDSQPELYAAVRNKFRNWKIPDSQLSQIEASGKVQTAFTIYAHVSGVVSEIMVSEGAHIADGHPIFKVADLRTVWAVFDAYENQVGRLKKGEEIDMVLNSYPDKKYKAKISFINPVLNSATRTIEVRAVLKNSEGQLKPGMFVAGTLAVAPDTATTTLIIPESAVLWTGKRSVVYVKVDADEPTFEMREVSLGDALDGGYSIVSGLENGDEIVTHGTFTVDAAAQLKGKKSMMNKEGGQTTTGHEGHEGVE
ncbi:efflux RND transporter periplasmic adaptor subunit [Spongiimicrobium sp. 2-473A-2-J]|uniref:efflux RND transporter periplasmic adaptor subunit n=1 Tax=Eudoraea algarum TaxID=3417568 RepID=UPI003D3646AE